MLLLLLILLLKFMKVYLILREALVVVVIFVVNVALFINVDFFLNFLFLIPLYGVVVNIFHLRTLKDTVEFLWCGGLQSHICVKPNLCYVRLNLS